MSIEKLKKEIWHCYAECDYSDADSDIERTDMYHNTGRARRRVKKYLSKQSTAVNTKRHAF